MGVRDRDPEGGPESRLWAAVVERRQEPEQLDQTKKPSPASDRHREVTSGDEPSSPPNPFSLAFFALCGCGLRFIRFTAGWDGFRKRGKLLERHSK